MKILFLYLDAFSQTGGIENFNKAFMKALSDLSRENDLSFKAVSVYDSEPDERYVAKENYAGFKRSKTRASFYAIKASLKYDQVIFGHINLAIVGIVIKLIRPSTKIILIAHGIEVWKKLVFLKGAFLRKTDKIFAVSNFTKGKLVTINKIDSAKIEILYNTIDPFFKIPDTFEKPAYLLDRYNIKKDSKIILTVTRMTNTESDKGYEKVIEIMPEIIKEYPEAIYMLAGKYDERVGLRIKDLVKQKGFAKNFILTGYLAESEMTDHYLLADVFILPSKQEGFGIVFIEALACGVPVIAGNRDGSVDALKNGEFGTLIDPNSTYQIKESLSKALNNSSTNNNLNTLIYKYGYKRFKKDLSLLVNNISTN